MRNRNAKLGMKFFFSGKPSAKDRPRFGKSKVYDSQYSKKIADKWNAAGQMVENGFKMIQNRPLRVEVYICTSLPKKSRRSLLNGFSIKKPDIDNVIKYYFDILNKIAYEDDSIIAEVYACKFFGEKDGVEINICELGENDDPRTCKNHSR